MKRRIVKINDRFFPQVKILFWWKFYWDSPACAEGPAWRECFETLGEAIDFIEQKTEKKPVIEQIYNIR